MFLLANSQKQQENVAAAASSVAQRHCYFLTVVVAAVALPDRHTGFVPPQMKLCCFQPIRRDFRMV